MATAAKIESIEKAMSAIVTEQHRSPEPRSQARVLDCVLLGRAACRMAARPEVGNRQIEEIEAAEDLEEPELEQDRRQEHGDDPEADRAPDSPLQDPATVVAGEMPDHHGQHQSVVGAQKTFQEHQHSDVPGDQGKVSEPGRPSCGSHLRRSVRSGCCGCSSGSSVGPRDPIKIGKKRRKYLYHNREAGATGPTLAPDLP